MDENRHGLDAFFAVGAILIELLTVVAGVFLIAHGVQKESATLLIFGGSAVVAGGYFLPRLRPKRWY